MINNNNQITQLTGSIVMYVFLTTGAIYTVYILDPNSLSSISEESSAASDDMLHWYDCFYFIIATITTDGDVDIYPG